MTTCEVSVIRECRRCRVEKPLEQFHRQPRGPMGRHSWCAQCCNVYYKERRRPTSTAAQRHKWNLSRRYGMSLHDFNTMRQTQRNLCAICEEMMAKPKVDHDHITGKVRGLLCHRCNLLLAGVESPTFLKKAMAYLLLPT